MVRVKNINKQKYYLCSMLSLIIIFLLLLILWRFIKTKNYFFVLDRGDSIIEERKKDTEDYQTVGWIRVQGTNLDMPIITINHQNPPVDREHYSWILNKDGELHNVMNVFGHNIFNLSSTPMAKSEYFQRFEELMSFVYYDYARENQYIQLTIDDQNYIYKIFSVHFLSSYQVSQLPTDQYSKAEKDDYLRNVKESSIYDYDVDVNSDDLLLSLITCTRLFGYNSKNDLIVTGRLIRKGEFTSHYDVTKSDKYQEIEKYLKGVDLNEKEEFA